MWQKYEGTANIGGNKSQSNTRASSRQFSVVKEDQRGQTHYAVEAPKKHGYKKNLSGTLDGTMLGEKQKSCRNKDIISQCSSDYARQASNKSAMQ